MERLLTGIFECPNCDVEYKVEEKPESQLVCERCGELLLALLIRITNKAERPAPIRKPEEQGKLFNG